MHIIDPLRIDQTFEDLLVELDGQASVRWRLLRAARKSLGALVPLSAVPHPGEAVRSLFFYDLYADGEDAFERLLDAAGELAPQRGCTVLYLLLCTGGLLLAWIRTQRFMRYQSPYRLPVRGRCVPRPDDLTYLDVRDV